MNTYLLLIHYVGSVDTSSNMINHSLIANLSLLMKFSKIKWCCIESYEHIIVNEYDDQL